jgi:Glycosyltransferase family 87
MMKRPMGRNDQISIWFVAGVFSLLWIYIGALSLPQGRVHDFQFSYGAARLILEGRTADLYGPSLVAGPDHDLPYSRPAAAALLYVPFALLPPDTAFALYTALWIVLLLVCWAWGYRTFGPFAVLLASMFMPATLGIAHAQDCVLYLALSIWSYSLALRERSFAAGGALGLMVLKFHLVLLWPVALILQRRWKMLAGFTATSTLLAAVSVAMVGISGTRAYIDVLLKPSPVSPSPEFTLSFTGLLIDLGIGSMAAKAILAIAIFGFFVLGLRHAALARLYAVTTAASLVLVPHAYGYDAARLLLPIWLVFFSSEWHVARTAAVLMATPFVYSFTLLGRPWAAIGSIATLTFLVLLAIEPLQARPPARNASIS